jgi:hypothetical protein
MIRTLQIALIVASLPPLLLGLMNFFAGASADWMPDGAGSANADNQLRFYAIWFMAPFPFAVWMALNLRSALPVAGIVFGTMFLGGLARLYSVTQVGLPDPPMIGAMIVEMAVVLFIPWIAYVQRRLDQGDTTPKAAPA